MVTDSLYFEFSSSCAAPLNGWSMESMSVENLVYALLIGAIVLLIIGCITKHQLALWIAETLVMGAVFAIIKEMFGTKGSLRGYTGRPRLRR